MYKDTRSYPKIDPTRIKKKVQSTPWEWIDACPTQEDARRLDKNLRCGGVGRDGGFRCSMDCTRDVSRRRNDCVKCSLEGAREGRTEEHVTDKAHERGRAFESRRDRVSWCSDVQRRRCADA